MEKLKMQSSNLVDANIEKIAKLFPNCVSEGKVDFDLLRQELSSTLIEGKDERYRLDWAGKRQAILTANSPIAKTLRPARAESVNFDATENLYIEGDNLDVLKLLHETYLGKVKMIYIDPPYNTGSDFVYEDDFAEDMDDYLARSNQVDDQGKRMTTNKDTDGRFHSDWLSMMYMRIRLAKDFLRDDGVIFMSIDDNEVHNLRKICDEVFGATNFVSNIIWQKKFSRANDATYFSTMHDHILCYAKNHILYNDAGWKLGLIPRGSETPQGYSNPDNDPRGAWASVSMTTKSGSAKGIYEIVTPSGRKCVPPSGRYWGVSKEKYETMLADNRITFGSSGDGVPRVKTFLSEIQDGLRPNSIWMFSEVGHNQEGKQECKELFDGQGVFDSPKPVRLLRYILTITNTKPDDIVMDFFSGSATTAHAIMQANAEDGKKCKYIMVQLPEETDKESEAYKNGYKNICEIGKERIRRAGKKISKGDVGFRVLKLADSNMREVFYNPKQYDQSMLLGLDKAIKDDRTAEDVLFQVMLEKGVSLSSKIDKKTTANGQQTYYIVGNTGFGLIDLICCLDQKINTEAVKEIAKLNAECVVFLDSGIANDATRTNIQQLFATYSPKTKVEVL